MKVLTVDNERASLHILDRAAAEAAPGAELHSFTSAQAALAEVEQRGLRPDAAFLDIEMPDMSGLELAGRIKLASPGTWIVFVTGFSQYALDAFAVRANGYLLKPVDAAQIRAELAQIGVRPAPAAGPDDDLQIQCFGNFEAFYRGKPLDFKRRKAKELFAYLVHKRGAKCTTRELAAVLFEDEPYDKTRQSYLQTIIAALQRTLFECGAGDVLVRRFGALSVDPAKLNCDYYRFIALDQAAVNSYTGEYMDQYEWAKFTAAFLSEEKFKN
ncbi:MAG: response regulator [Oscillospiraceae bacterium]|nr:response regulator [Oscillospiraceae bacterium]